MTPAVARGPAPASQKRGRSITVDFFRGLGLWIIYTDHIDPNVWSHLTLWRFGFSDFAEIFVFLSGMIGVRSYDRALAEGDTATVLRKLSRRMLRLYLAHILSLSLSLIILAVFAARGLRVNDSIMYVWMQNPAAYVARILLLLYAPHLYGLLPLYILISPILLLAAIGLRRAPLLTICLSAALWATAQVPALDHFSGPSTWFFRPLAWQFLFVIGAATELGSQRLKAVVRWPAVLAASAAMVAGSAALKCLTFSKSIAARLPQSLLEILQRDAGKPVLAPLRLLHFMALLILVCALIRDRRRWQRWWIAQLAIVSGRDSLVIYCCTLVLDTAANLILAATRGGPVLQAELNLAGLAVLCAIAWMRRQDAPVHWDISGSPSQTEQC